MKTLILSDIHDQNPQETIRSLDRLIEHENIEKLVFLGDCDSPLIYKYLLDSVLDKRIITGNHEYAWANNIEIFSSFLKSPPETYIEQWNKFPELKKYVLENSNLSGEASGKMVIDNLSGRNILYSHCDITWGSSLDSEYCFRLNSRGIIQDSFREMRRENYWLWFKGHDHVSQVLSLPLDVNPYNRKYREETLSVKFIASNRYIIRVGCFALGVYAILDEKNMKLEFKGIIEK